MDKAVLSSHVLLTDYSMKKKLKTVVTGWIIFLIIFTLTRLPNIQDTLTSLAENLQVEWVTSNVRFILGGLWIFFIPMTIGTFLTINKKHTFDKISLFKDGVEFSNSKDQTSCYLDYSKVTFTPGSMQQSLCIHAPEANIKNAEYSWSEFTQPDVLQNNIERYVPKK